MHDKFTNKLARIGKGSSINPDIEQLKQEVFEEVAGAQISQTMNTVIGDSASTSKVNIPKSVDMVESELIIKTVEPTATCENAYEYDEQESQQIFAINLEIEEDMDVMYLEDGFLEDCEEADNVEMNAASDSEEKINTRTKKLSIHSLDGNSNNDTSDSFLCERCNKNIKLRVKNHICVSEQTYT